MKEAPFRILLKWALVGFVFLLLLGAAKDLLCQSLLRRYMMEVTGLPVTIGTVHVSLLHSTLEAKEVLFHNPEGFGDQSFIRISELFVDLAPLGLLKGKCHLRRIWIGVEEYFVIKNQEGVTNVDAFTRVSPPFQKGGTGEREKGREGITLQVDHLSLTVSRMIAKDNGKNPPEVQPLETDSHERRFENLRTMEEILKAVFLSPLSQEANALWPSATR